MRSALQLTGLGIALVAGALWFFSGPNVGWTKTSQERLILDPVTGLHQREYVSNFLPGVDFFFGGILLGGLVAALSLLFKRGPSGTIRESESRPPAASS